MGGVIVIGFAVLLAGAVIGWAVMRPPALPVPAMPASHELDPEVVQLVERYTADALASPRDGAAHGRLGLVLEANSQWALAAQCFANAARLENNDGLWAYHQAIAVRQAGDVDGALAILQSLAREHPELPALHHRLGHALLEDGRLDDAMAAFQRAAQLAPTAPEPMIGRGEVMVHRGQYEQALRTLNLALQVNSSITSARYLRGLALRGLGREEEAALELAAGADGKTLFMRDPLSSELQRFAVNLSARLGQAADLIEAGRPSQAASMLERTLQSRPGEVLVMNQLASAYQGMRQHERALNLLLQARSIDPTEVATFINLAACALELGRHRDALDYADEAIALDDQYAQAHYLRARTLAALGRYVEGTASMERAIRLDTRNPDAYVALAEMYFLMSQNTDDPTEQASLLQKSRENYEITVRLIPNLLPPHVSLAGVCLRLGDIRGAEAAMEPALRLAPQHERVQTMQQRIIQLKAEYGIP